MKLRQRVRRWALLIGGLVLGGCVTGPQPLLSPQDGLALLPGDGFLYGAVKREGNEALLTMILSQWGMKGEYVKELIGDSQQLFLLVGRGSSGQDHRVGVVIKGRFRRTKIGIGFTLVEGWKPRDREKMWYVNEEQGLEISLPDPYNLYFALGGGMEDMLARRDQAVAPPSLTREVWVALEKSPVGFYFSREGLLTLSLLIADVTKIPVKYAYITFFPQEGEMYGTEWVFRSVDRKQARAIGRILRLLMFTKSPLFGVQAKDKRNFLKGTRVRVDGSKVTCKDISFEKDFLAGLIRMLLSSP